MPQEPSSDPLPAASDVVPVKPSASVLAFPALPPREFPGTGRHHEGWPSSACVSFRARRGLLLGRSSAWLRRAGIRQRQAALAPSIS